MKWRMEGRRMNEKRDGWREGWIDCIVLWVNRRIAGQIDWSADRKVVSKSERRLEGRTEECSGEGGSLKEENL